MNPAQWIMLIVIAISAPAVALCRSPVSQTVALSFYGVLLSLLFMVFQAPDVALSQITIGTVVLPLMILLALGRIRVNEELRRRENEEKKKEAA